MAIERANLLYPRLSISVDTGTGINVKNLDDTNSGSDDDQTVTATHTQDNVERTFEPDVNGVTAVEDARNLQRKGWGLGLFDITPADDTNCNAFLNSGTLTVNLRVAMSAAGGTGFVGGNHSPAFRASLWRYNPSTDAGVSIASGSATQTWNLTPVTGDGGTFKNTAISINVASDVEFLQGETLLLQIGVNTGTLANPVSGTTTFTFDLRVDHNNTNIDFAANQNIHITCNLSGTATGIGTVTEQARNIGLSRIITGIGTASFTKAVAAAKSFTITGIGTVSHNKNVGLTVKTVTGKGEVSGRITIPIDEIPEGGGGGGDTIVISPIFD